MFRYFKGHTHGQNRSPLAERTGIYENISNLAYTRSETRNIGISVNISSGSPCGIGLRLYMNTTAKPLLYILQAERPPIFPIMNKIRDIVSLQTLTMRTRGQGTGLKR